MRIATTKKNLISHTYKFFTRYLFVIFCILLLNYVCRWWKKNHKFYIHYHSTTNIDYVVHGRHNWIHYQYVLYFIHICERESPHICDDVYDKKQNSRKEKLCEIFYLQASLPFSIYEYLNLSHFQQDKQGRRICSCCCCYVVLCRCCLNT